MFEWSLASGLALVARLVVLAVLAALCVAASRWIRRQSPLLGNVFAAGVLIRAVGGAALFAISLFGLPIFRQLQLGDGFWSLALDGRTYYEIAVNAVAHGLGTISDTAPSPFYLRVLTAWMWLCGESPASALLLNVVCYVASAMLILTAAGRQRSKRPVPVNGTVVTLAAVTLSPALVIFSTQPLKDALCTLLMIAAIVGTRVWWTAVRDGDTNRISRMCVGLLLMGLGIYGIAGIRAYVALFSVVAIAVAAAYSVASCPAGRSRVGDLLTHGGLVAVLWATFVVGAGPYGGTYESLMLSAPGTSLAALDQARSGFIRSGGATSLAGLAGTESDDGMDLAFGSAGKGPWSRIIGRLDRLLHGYVVSFVPISVLRMASVVEFTGGRGLLLITDLDTVLMDVTVVVGLGLLFQSARRYGVAAETVFVLVFSVLTTAALAYVVTNYGTLFRLRLLGATPLWMLPVMIRVAGSTAPKDGPVP